MEAGFRDMRVRESEFGPKWSDFGLVKGKPLNSNNKMSPPPKSPYLGDSEKIANLELQIKHLNEGKVHMMTFYECLQKIEIRQNEMDRLITKLIKGQVELLSKIS